MSHPPNPEFFGLSWPGKKIARAASQSPPLGQWDTASGWHSVPQESVKFNRTKNLFLEGDNLEGLKVLRTQFQGQVRGIYIDPPYNTGSNLLYKDRFSPKDWLSAIYPRLLVAHQLLSSDGFICISIHDAQLAHLRLVLDEVFGADNYLNTVAVNTKAAAGVSGGGRERRLKKNLEYIVIYTKHMASFPSVAHLHRLRPLEDVIRAMDSAGESWKYTSILQSAGPRQLLGQTVDGHGQPITVYKRKNVQRTTVSKIMQESKMSQQDVYQKYFASIFSDTNAQSSIRQRVIHTVGSLGPNEILEVEYIPRSGRDKGQTVCHTYISPSVRRVIWLKDSAEQGSKGILKKEKLGTYWDHIDYNNVGKEGGVPFPDGKKPVALLQTCIGLHPAKDGIYLDFYAGSGSFGHACLLQNWADGGNRRYILVQNNEEIRTKESRYASAVQFYRDNGIDLNVAAVARARLRRVDQELQDIARSDGGNKQALVDSGFQVWRLTPQFAAPKH